MSGISLKSSDILSVSELKSAASKISSAKLEKIDINEIDEDNHEVYIILKLILILNLV